MARKTTSRSKSRSKAASKAASRKASQSQSTPAPASITPAQLRDRLTALAMNLRWTWDHPTQALFARLDPALCHAVQRNPIALLHDVTPYRLELLAADPSYVAQLEACEKSLSDYISAPTWFEGITSGRGGAADRKMQVAYFCAEFALHESLPIYSGGLGVLAGDHLKAASDLGLPFCAVGLLYRYGYYRQEINGDGSTKVTYPPYDFDRLPLTDTGKSIRLSIGPGRGEVEAKIWLAQVGRVPLYLLDTDHKGNTARQREITHHLYGGDSEMRIKQEVLLGVGGVMALEAVGVDFTVLHLNEGHAAFAPMKVVSELVTGGTAIEDAVEAVRGHTVFTTHTPVPAGHDRFEPKLAKRYLTPLLKNGGVSAEDVLCWGDETPLGEKTPKDAPLCMTALALRLAGHCNGVAELHGQVSRAMWRHLYDVKRVNDVPIGYVTNGVHPQTWLAPEATPLYQKYLKPNWLPNPAASKSKKKASGKAAAKARVVSAFDDVWRSANKVPDDALWSLRTTLRTKLVRFVREHLAEQAYRRGSDVQALALAHDALRDDALTIGFARRFATYKRAPLIFHDLKRVMSIIADDDKPVQLVFAGKAHPKDAGGQAYLQKVVKLSRNAGFKGRVVVLENYDMNIGRMLTSGCDVWLNNPLRPNEASGTSGMKPPLHGGINFSILDGWWPEGYNRRNGFVIGGEQFNSQKKQDAYDAGSIYDVLEQRIVPMFYQRGRDGLPKRWVKMMRESLRSVCGTFNTHRMVGEYAEQYYLPAHR